MKPVRIPALILPLVALTGLTLFAGAARAADPDRTVHEPDVFDGDVLGEELEMRIEAALEGLDELDGLQIRIEGLTDEIGEVIEQALRESAVHVDEDWPDRIWITGDGADLEFDTRAFARRMQRMSRHIQRSVLRDLERGPSGDTRVRVWRYDDEARDRQEIEAEMRDLQREMRRLQRELEELEAEGDI